MECTVRWTGLSGMTFLAETGSGHVLAMDGAPEGGPPGLEPGGPFVYRLLLRVLLVRQLHGADEHPPFLLAGVRRARALVCLELPAHPFRSDGNIASPSRHAPGWDRPSRR